MAMRLKVEQFLLVVTGIQCGIVVATLGAR
jgi:hypothetical protein